MRGKSLSSNIPCSNFEEPTECMVNLSVPQLKPGDIAWSRINDGSWWPVQVVDEKCVAFKPTKRKNDQVLVRLYGSFEHLYLEPINRVLKIENIYGQENCSGKELFKKALEEDLAHMISSCRSKRKFCESKENEKDEAPGGKSRRKGKLKRALVADSPVVVSSTKQVKVAVDKDMNAVQASADGLPMQDEMKSAGLKRRTRSETFKARNAGKSAVEVSNEAENANNGPSIVNCSTKKDSMNFRHKDAEEKVTANIHDKTCESKCVNQDSGYGTSVNENVRTEFSDIKSIKKFVTKIVKEIAAEKAQNKALEGRGVQVYPENTKCMECSRKDTSEIKHMNKCSPRRVNDKDSEAHLTKGNTDDPTQRCITSEIKHMNKCSPIRVNDKDSKAHLTKGNTDDPTQDEISGLSDVGKPNMAEKEGMGASLVKISRQYNLRKRGFDSGQNFNGISKDTRVDACNPTARKQSVIDMSNIAEQAKEDTQGINGVNSCQMATSKGHRLKKMVEVEKALANIAKQGGVVNSSGTEMARNGDQSGKDASREQMESHGSTKCKVPEEHEDLSLRSTRVMQTLGLIAPSGSPFSKNGLIKSLLPDFTA